KHATSSTFKYIPKHLLKNKIFSQLMTNESFQNLFSLAQSDKESNMWAQLADFGRRGLLSNSSREYLIFKNMLAGMDLRSICYLRSKNEDLLTNPNLTYENVARFACAAKALNWDGPVVAMTDCTKIMCAAKALNWDGPVVAMTDCTKVHLKLSYSHSKHLHKVSNIMRLDNAHENINTNTANQLITQITSNDSGQTVRRRVTRWQGRKNIENMFRTNDNMPDGDNYKNNTNDNGKKHLQEEQIVINVEDNNHYNIK
ncbi:13691_t:CDS:2, partial [Entrophospora sp. SA101]